MQIQSSLLDIIGFVEEHQSFAIIGHEEPDGDCICSQLVLAHYLDGIGKKAACYSPGPFLRPEIAEFRDQISSEPLGDVEAIIVVDCSTPKRIGDYFNQIESKPIAVIDHHSSGEPFGNVRYVDPAAPSVTYLVQQIIDKMGGVPDRYEAELLLFGLCTDTGFFRHLEVGATDVFSSVARLVSYGASPRDTYRRMYGNRSYESRKLLGKLMERVEKFLDGRLLATWEDRHDLHTFGKTNRDSDTLFQQLQRVRNCQVIVLVREEGDGTCSVSLRSNNGIDVGAMAKEFDGGGHAKAAGYTRTGSVEQVKKEIISIIHEQLESHTSSTTSDL